MGFREMQEKLENNFTLLCMNLVSANSTTDICHFILSDVSTHHVIDTFIYFIFFVIGARQFRDKQRLFLQRKHQYSVFIMSFLWKTCQVFVIFLPLLVTGAIETNSTGCVIIKRF